MEDMEWSELIKSLINRGYTEENIAEAARTTQPAIHCLKTGKTSDPKYRTGAAILRLCTLNNIPIFNHKKTPVGQD